MASKYAFAHQVLLNKYYVDEFYHAFIVRPIMVGMNWLWNFDSVFIDGIVIYSKNDEELYCWPA